jgi:hypothetical protein
MFAFSLLCMPASSFAAKGSLFPPMSDAQRKAFFGTPEDVLKKKPCKGNKRVTLHCRDKEHYVVSNESHHELYRGPLKGIRGGYIGVGSDQNFTLMSFARSEFAWMMDYDPVVVWMNHVHRGLILKAPTRQAYLRLWTAKSRSKALSLLAAVYKGHRLKRRVLWTYRNWRSFVRAHQLRQVIRLRKARIRRGDKRIFSWLHSDDTYGYIRAMFQANRIRIMKGDLLLNTSLRGIGRVTRKFRFPVRIVYLSNAEEFWPYTKNFRANMRGLHMDKRSRLVRTRYGKHYRGMIGRWMYLLQSGLDFQKGLGLPKTKSVFSFLKRRKFVTKGLFSIGL